MASIFRPAYTDKKTGRTRKLKRWYVKYRDADGIVRRVQGLHRPGGHEAAGRPPRSATPPAARKA